MGSLNLPNFIEHAKQLGYEISSIADENGSSSVEYKLPDVIADSLSNK